MNIYEHLKEAEGFRAHPYADGPEGNNQSIGYGRNLTSLGISESEAMTMLTNDVERVRSELKDRYDWYLTLDPFRAMTVEALVYNIGITRFGQFKKCIAGLSQGKWEDAAVEIFPNSLYAKQVPDRALKYATWIKNGVA